MPLKIDLHVHTCYSGDSLITPSELIAEAVRKGLDGISITDHDTVAGALKMIRMIRGGNCGRPIIIPGIEVSTRSGHILGINVLEPIPRGLSVEETVERIHDAGGIAIAAHPQTFFKDGVGLSPKILRFGLDAIEVINSSLFPFYPLTRIGRRFAEHYNIPQTAGSDAHIVEAIGLSYTLVKIDDLNADSIIEAIRRGLTTPFGRGIPIQLRIKKALKIK
ncbi:MAG: CehA/McbA family metallohydrolase [Candidatus Bathyarchaeia archaeon]